MQFHVMRVDTLSQPSEQKKNENSSRSIPVAVVTVVKYDVIRKADEICKFM